MYIILMTSAKTEHLGDPNRRYIGLGMPLIFDTVEYAQEWIDSPEADHTGTYTYRIFELVRVVDL